MVTVRKLAGSCYFHKISLFINTSTGISETPMLSLTIHGAKFIQALTSYDPRDKLEEQSRDLERLRKQLSAKEEMERRQIDAVCQLNATNQRLEQAVKDVAAENAELEGKMTVLKSALDTAYRCALKGMMGEGC